MFNNVIRFNLFLDSKIFYKIKCCECDRVIKCILYFKGFFGGNILYVYLYDVELVFMVCER